MKKIKIAVDIGNSNVVIGLYTNGKWEKIYRLSTKKNFTYWSFQKKLKKINIVRIIKIHYIHKNEPSNKKIFN